MKKDFKENLLSIQELHKNLLDQCQAYSLILPPSSGEARTIVAQLQGQLEGIRQELGSLLEELESKDPIENPLSKRENEVLLLVSEGHPNKEIAYRLSISDRTVQFHIKSIFTKKQVSRRAEAATEALKRGWINE